LAFRRGGRATHATRGERAGSVRGACGERAASVRCAAVRVGRLRPRGRRLGGGMGDAVSASVPKACATSCALLVASSLEPAPASLVLLGPPRWSGATG
jgi:hypothetical protein